MVVFDDRWDDRRGATGPFGFKRVRSLGDAPSVVATSLDTEDHLPEVLADIAGPEVAGGGVEAHFPRLAQAVGPDLRPCPLGLQEGVVSGDGVGKFFAGMVNIDPQDRAGEIGEILSGEVEIGDAAAVAGGDVEVAIGTELQAAAIVSSRGPLQQDLLTLGVAAWRLTRQHAEP